MLEGDYDVAEFSLSSFLIARDKGLPIIGIPIFPRRLFSMSQMWVHPDSPYRTPRDLIGKKVALSAFQTTLSLLARGDLKEFYDTPWEQIHWLLTSPEKIKIRTKPGVKVDYIGNRQGLGEALARGEVDAFFLPHPPKSVSIGQARARRLFENPRKEELNYFLKAGDFPIMHVMAIRTDLVEARPGLARAIYDMFEAARAITQSYYEDPNWSLLAWGLQDLEEERAALGRDPWENGFRRNRATLERFIRYAHDQELIQAPFDPAVLFAPETLVT
jgi:4,5-dihydroxyphthalate decarboxylase